MGAEPYWYFEKYAGDINTALQTLREREFRAGRYNPVISFPDSPVGPNSPSPGSKHASIDEARMAAAEEGTRSILDLDHVSDFPEVCAVAPLPEEVLEDLYSTTQPTRELVEKNLEFLEEIERGHGIFMLLYTDGHPTEILFAGYSFD